MPDVSYRTDSLTVDSDAVELWPVYDAVFGDVGTFEEWRAGTWDRHRAREGFRLVRAWTDGALVGFAYGYTGRHGQWWTDNAARVMDETTRAEWLDGHFELVSLGVLTTERRRGTGRALLRAVVDGLPHDRMLLMTSSDAADPAFRLYLSEGWRVLGRGIGEGTVIMGRRGAG